MRLCNSMAMRNITLTILSASAISLVGGCGQNQSAGSEGDVMMTRVREWREQHGTDPISVGDCFVGEESLHEFEYLVGQDDRIGAELELAFEFPVACANPHRYQILSIYPSDPTVDYPDIDIIDFCDDAELSFVGEVLPSDTLRVDSILLPLPYFVPNYDEFACVAGAFQDSVIVGSLYNYARN